MITRYLRSWRWASAGAALSGWVSPAPRLHIQTIEGVEEPSLGRGRAYWVVSRGLCRFCKVPLLPDVPSARQFDALTLAARRASPFAETGWQFHLGEAFACLWLWDRRATSAAIEAIGLDERRLRIVPEPALQPPAADGVRLVETSDGIEAQSWIAGALAASRWWRHLPADREWVLFQRGASVPPERMSASAPRPQLLPWLPRPWPRSRPRVTFAIAELDMRIAAALAAAVILVLYGYFGAQWLRSVRETAAVTAEINRRSQEIEPILDARSRALENLAAIRRLGQLDPFPTQLALMTAVAGVLPQDQARLTEWAYDRDQLDIGLSGDRPLDVVGLVRELEGLDHVKSVAAERAGADNALRLRLTINPL